MAIQDTATLLKQSQAMLDQTKKEGTTSFKGSSYDTFGSADLNPPGKFTPSPVPPATGAAGMQAEIGSNVDYVDQLSQQRKQDEANLRQSIADRSELLKSLRGKTSLTAEAYGKKGGVDDIQVELNDINQQIRAEQHSLARRVEEMEKNRQGMFGGAMEQEVRNLERESLRKQADLYVIQQGVQGRYDSAKAIADRAVSAYLEEQEILLKQYDADYEAHRDLFSQSEQREFQVLQEERQNAFEMEKTKMIEISDLSLEAMRGGAPTSVVSQMRSAKTVADAIALGGSYIGALDRMKANASIVTEQLQQKKLLIDLAKEGDEDAIKELGYDPSSPKTKDLIATQDEVNRLDQEIARITGMLSNDTGLQASSGVVRSPLLTSLGVNVPMGAGLGFGAGSIVPGLGNVAGTAAGTVAGVGTGLYHFSKTNDAKAKFLAEAKYVAVNMTADKIKELKDKGISFTPLSNEEVRLIGQSATTLNGYAITGANNEIIGFTSEEGVREALAEISKILQKARDREMDKLVSDAERSEIEAQ